MLFSLLTWSECAVIFFLILNSLGSGHIGIYEGLVWW